MTSFGLPGVSQTRNRSPSIGSIETVAAEPTNETASGVPSSASQPESRKPDGINWLHLPKPCDGKPTPLKDCPGSSTERLERETSIGGIDVDESLTEPLVNVQPNDIQSENHGEQKAKGINWLPQTKPGDVIPTPLYTQSSSDPLTRPATEKQPVPGPAYKKTIAELEKASKAIDFRLIHLAVGLASTHHDLGIYGSASVDSLRAKHTEAITEEALRRTETYERLTRDLCTSPAEVAQAYLLNEHVKLNIALLKEGIAFDALQKWRMCLAYAAQVYGLDMPLNGFKQKPMPATGLVGTASGPEEGEKGTFMHFPPELRTVKREEFVEKVRMGGLEEERASPGLEFDEFWEEGDAGDVENEEEVSEEAVCDDGAEKEIVEDAVEEVTEENRIQKNAVYEFIQDFDEDATAEQEEKESEERMAILETVFDPQKEEKSKKSTGELEPNGSEGSNESFQDRSIAPSHHDLTRPFYEAHKRDPEHYRAHSNSPFKSVDNDMDSGTRSSDGPRAESTSPKYHAASPTFESQSQVSSPTGLSAEGSYVQSTQEAVPHFSYTMDVDTESGFNVDKETTPTEELQKEDQNLRNYTQIDDSQQSEFSPRSPDCDPPPPTIRTDRNDNNSQKWRRSPQFCSPVDCYCRNTRSAPSSSICSPSSPTFEPLEVEPYLLVKQRISTILTQIIRDLSTNAFRTNTFHHLPRIISMLNDISSCLQIALVKVNNWHEAIDPTPSSSSQVPTNSSNTTIVSMSHHPSGLQYNFTADQHLIARTIASEAHEKFSKAATSLRRLLQPCIYHPLPLPEAHKWDRLGVHPSLITRMKKTKADIEQMGDATAHMFASLFLLAVGRAPPKDAMLLLHPPKCLVADRERRVPGCIPLVYLPIFTDDEQLGPALDSVAESEAAKTKVHPEVGIAKDAEKTRTEVLRVDRAAAIEAHLQDDIEKGKKRALEIGDDEHSHCTDGEDETEVAWRRLGKERGYDFGDTALAEEGNSAGARRVKRRKLTKWDPKSSDEAESEDSDVSP